MIALALLMTPPPMLIPSRPELGKAAGRCRPDESGPAFLVDVRGLKDRQGLLKLELYPANDEDFLQDDNVLVAAGKAFARVEMPVPASGPARMCIRAPAPGAYALSLLHDRDSNRKFGLSVDGVGFPNDPRLGWSRPRAARVTARVGASPVSIAITLQYRHGLLSVGPIKP
jgi:uncharacterized protein (DUF2141 family)